MLYVRRRLLLTGTKHTTHHCFNAQKRWTQSTSSTCRSSTRTHQYKNNWRQPFRLLPSVSSSALPNFFAEKRLRRGTMAVAANDSQHRYSCTKLFYIDLKYIYWLLGNDNQSYFPCNSIYSPSNIKANFLLFGSSFDATEVTIDHPSVDIRSTFIK